MHASAETGIDERAAQRDADLRAFLLDRVRHVPGIDCLMRWCPQVPLPAQARFLRLPQLEAGYGGAAGPGKSSALGMCGLQYVDRPGYAALILRRAFTDLTKPGALMDRLHQWLAPTGATWNAQTRSWRFPTAYGARPVVTFGYCESLADVYQYQGGEYQTICIDECTQWSLEAYVFLLSRLRRLKGVDIPIRMRSGTNPGGLGHEWYGKRFRIGGMKPDEDDGKERPFIHATLDQNPHLDVEAYDTALALLDATTHAQLRKGLWVRDRSKLVYPIDRPTHIVRAELVETLRAERWHPSLGNPPVAREPWRAVLIIDLGASETKHTTAYAVLLWSPQARRSFVATAWAEPGIDVTSIAERIEETRASWPEVDQIVMDEGALGALVGRQLRMRHGLPVLPADKQNRRGWIRMLRGAIERCELLYSEDAEEAVAEAEKLAWDKHGLDYQKGLPDHCTDAVMYGYRWVQSWKAPEGHESPPAPGTEQWLHQEAARLKAEAKQRAASRARDTEGRSSVDDMERW